MPVATKKLRSNRAWIERHINDPFVKRSKAEGYRARSVYKLTELDDREHLLRRGMTVVELHFDRTRHLLLEHDEFVLSF